VRSAGNGLLKYQAQNCCKCALTLANHCEAYADVTAGVFRCVILTSRVYALLAGKESFAFGELR
jgi:hypothetical protein